MNLKPCILASLLVVSSAFGFDIQLSSETTLRFCRVIKVYPDSVDVAYTNGSTFEEGVILLRYEQLPPEIQRMYFDPRTVAQYRNKLAAAETQREAAAVAVAVEKKRQVEEAKAKEVARLAAEYDLQIAQQQKIKAAQEQQLAEEAAADFKRREQQKEHVKLLRKDLDVAISDLKAKWFPKRSKVENYDIIVKTVSAIDRISNWNSDEMNSWGLSELDISEIRKTSSALNQGNVIQTELRGEIKSLKKQNRELSDEIRAAKHAAQEGAYESRRAATLPLNAQVSGLPVDSSQIKSGTISAGSYDVTLKDGTRQTGNIHTLTGPNGEKNTIAWPDGGGRATYTMPLNGGAVIIGPSEN